MTTATEATVTAYNDLLTANKSFAEVIVSIAHPEVDRIFHYRVPGDMRDCVFAGSRVTVPFGKGGKLIEGYVVGFSDPAVEESKIKDIVALPDGYPVITPVMLELAVWMKEKYYATLSQCLRCVTPAGLNNPAGASGSQKTLLYVKLDESSPDFTKKLTEVLNKGGPQAKILDYLRDNGPKPLAALTRELGVSGSPVNTLKKNGLLTITPVTERRDVIDQTMYKSVKALVLTDEQQSAVTALLSKMGGTDKKPVLIHGVTGSGKTEIYLRLIEETLKTGKQAIMLVPEISLTPQAVETFTLRFGSRVTVTHSRLTPAERLDQWRKAREGAVSVIIGPRSAIFTPFANLGVIIIDEEHEKTYYSETTPKYAVGQVAQKLSELTGALVVMGSATPSVETFYFAGEGEFELITLTHRVNNRFPDIYIADMRQELAMGNKSIFSGALREAIASNVADGNQTILFMNRRGHSTFVSCRGCGYVMECDNCSVNYTYHMYNDTLLCHYCGKQETPPAVCPVCGSRHIRYFGVGTQRIEEEIGRLFPGVNAIRMDMDTTSRKNSHERIIRRFATGEAQILIGTQMIAKGLNFPNVSLVGIMDADTSLNMGDFRSAETTFQLITQVSGRAGRAGIPGRVFIQTYNPEHYSVAYAKDGDYGGFYSHEIRLRRQMDYPPFSHIFMVLMTCDSERRLILALKELARLMDMYNRKGFFEMIGPAPAIVSKINGNYRWKILVKGQDEGLLKQFVFHCAGKLAKSVDLAGIGVNMTLDPRVLA